MTAPRTHRTGNLRPAPIGLTTDIVGRFLALGDALAASKSPLDASVAPSGRTDQQKEPSNG